MKKAIELQFYLRSRAPVREYTESGRVVSRDQRVSRPPNLALESHPLKPHLSQSSRISVKNQEKANRKRSSVGCSLSLGTE